MNFFAEALHHAMKEHRFNQAQLAEHVGVDPAYISRWLRGSSPRLDQMTAILSTLGWDIERARPDYDPFDDAARLLEEDENGRRGRRDGGGKTTPGRSDEGIKELLVDASDRRRRREIPIRHVGHVDSESGLISAHRRDKQAEFSLIGEALPELEFAGKDIGILEVRGDGIPEYPDGAYLFIRSALKPGQIPDGTDIVLDSPDGNPGKSLLVRLYRMHEPESSRVERIIGAPVASSQRHVFVRSREARIQYVVVGTLIPSF